MDRLSTVKKKILNYFFHQKGYIKKRRTPKHIIVLNVHCMLARGGVGVMGKLPLIRD